MSSAGQTFRGSAYPPAWRVVAGVLRTISGTCLPLLFILLVTVNDPPLAPPLLLRLFVIWFVAPTCAAWLIRRAFALEIRFGTTQLELLRRDLRVEVPFASIERLVPWRVPLPQPGVSLQLQSGHRFHWGLALDDPSRLLAALSLISPVPVSQVVTHPTLVYARARATQLPRRLPYLLAKFAGFALLPATILFYTHQSIAHGGPFGEYYTFGLGAYLSTYAVYWSTITIYLVLYASIWRGAAEMVCLLAAWSAPSWALAVRRTAERASALLYYAGVPVILALRYLA